MNNDKKITIRIPEAMHRDICALCLERSWSISDVIRAAVCFYFGAKGAALKREDDNMQTAIDSFEEFYSKCIMK